jgi:hypothetical protein
VGTHRFLGGPFRALALFSDPGRASRPSRWRFEKCCPRSQHCEGPNGQHDFEVQSHGFGTCCLRFKTHVTECPARLASGWSLAFTGRELNPRDRAERFPTFYIVFPLSQALPVASWAHARRYFHEATVGTGDTRGFAALAFIHQLFEVERDATDKEMTFEQRRDRRQEVSREILDAFKLWLEDLEPQVLPKSALATAIGYARRQWAALERYLDDGELVPDNSASERALRGVALGRKNWLFAGSDAGGARAAKLYSLIAGAKRHALEPYAYLRVLFERLPSHPADRLHELAPATWAANSAVR